MHFPSLVIAAVAAATATSATLADSDHRPFATQASLSGMTVYQDGDEQQNDHETRLQRLEELLEDNLAAVGEHNEMHRGQGDKPKPKRQWEVRIFQPKVRVFFDTGSDDPGEPDFFENGVIAPTVSFVEFHLPFKHWDKLAFPDEWTWGPDFGIGLSTPVSASGDTEVALFLSAGLLFEFPLRPGMVSDKSEFDTLMDSMKVNSEDREKLKAQLGNQIIGGPKLGLELGYMWGITANEGASDVDDGAIYVGLNLFIPF